MSKNMVYLNNAATSYPKPPSVVKAMTAAMDCPPNSPLRSNAMGCGLLPSLRHRLGRLLGIADTDRIFFCSSATDAVNRVLGGLRWSGYAFSANSHNSILRPMANNLLHDAGSKFSVMAYNHCSNVTGEIIDVRHECEDAHRKGYLFLLDAAQSAGCIPIDVDGWGVDMLVFTGHKALFGPTGTGGYYVRRGIPLRPTQFGGTGRDSSIITYDDGDWEYEVGTQNMVGLAGLKAGVDYVLERGVEKIFKKQQRQTAWLIETLRAIRNVSLYVASTHRPIANSQRPMANSRQGPIVSFNIEGLQPADVGYILQNSYGITVRTGLHCAPLLHQQLGTGEYGTVRVSLSDFTTQEDLEALVTAVSAIANSL